MSLPRNGTRSVDCWCRFIFRAFNFRPSDFRPFDIYPTVVSPSRWPGEFQSFSTVARPETTPEYDFRFENPSTNNSAEIRYGLNSIQFDTHVNETVFSHLRSNPISVGSVKKLSTSLDIFTLKIFIALRSRTDVHHSLA